VELGAVALIVAYSLKTGIPFVIIRKGGREHGTKRKIEGEILPGEKVLLLEDVVTSGGSVLQAIDRIEEEGGNVAAVLSVVDREEGGTEKLKERVDFLPLVRAKQLLEMTKTI
jgi:orotate phosphoribosyltransferase